MSIPSNHKAIIGKCGRCGGQIYLDHDKYGVFEECIQCGFVRDHDKTGAVVPIAYGALIASPRTPTAKELVRV